MLESVRALPDKTQIALVVLPLIVLAIYAYAWWLARGGRHATRLPPAAPGLLADRQRVSALERRAARRRGEHREAVESPVGKVMQFRRLL